MERSVQVAPHSLALVLSQHCAGDGEDPPLSTSSTPSPSACPSAPDDLQHHSGYEVFANFKAVNMQHFWNKALTQALGHIFFLGWIDERVLLIQGKEVHLQVLRNGWTRRTLKPPQGFDIENMGELVGWDTQLLKFELSQFSNKKLLKLCKVSPLLSTFPKSMAGPEVTQIIIIFKS